MSPDVLISFFSSAIVACIPILFAALGEVFTERSGVMNLGLEGTMLMGAVAGYVTVVRSGSLGLGVLAAEYLTSYKIVRVRKEDGEEDAARVS